MRIGEKINIAPKRALSVDSYIIILATPSPLCYMPTSWGRRYFLKIASYGSKIDFDQRGKWRSGSSISLQKCSLRLVWPPPVVVSMWVTSGRKYFFGDFQRYWEFEGTPQIWLTPPSYTVREIAMWEIEPDHFWCPYSWGRCRSLFGPRK